MAAGAGQTVASSLQAPELFVVAEDLSRMKLNVGVDEADVGRVEPGQKATFEVAAWPGRQFDAVVEKIDLSPTTTTNVVTYAASLAVDNTDGLLRPGMTANATIVTGRREGVLRIPNAALRFRPDSGASEQSAGSPLLPGGQRFRNRQSPSATASAGGRGTVYVLRDDIPTEVRVRTGQSDGRFTEILDGELREGDEVVLGLGAPEDGDRSRDGGAR